MATYRTASPFRKPPSLSLNLPLLDAAHLYLSTEKGSLGKRKLTIAVSRYKRLLAHFGNVRLSKIHSDSRNIAEYKDARTIKHATPRQVSSDLNALSQLFASCNYVAVTPKQRKG